MPTKGLSGATLYDEAAVREKMGVAPAQIPDYKALAGDPSDNYSGVSGIGPKTASDLLNQFGNLDNLYRAVEEGDETLSSTLREKLIQGKESASMSKQLATIRTDAPVVVDLRQSRISSLNTSASRRALESLHFSKDSGRLLQRKERQRVGNRSYFNPENPAHWFTPLEQQGSFMPRRKPPAGKGRKRSHVLSEIRQALNLRSFMEHGFLGHSYRIGTMKNQISTHSRMFNGVSLEPLDYPCSSASFLSRPWTVDFFVLGKRGVIPAVSFLYVLQKVLAIFRGVPARCGSTTSTFPIG